MPTYQYACTDSACGHRLEAVQSFSDDPLTSCPVCEGRLRKVFSPVGIVFKGSGFYRTDSREKPKAAAKDGKDSGKSEQKVPSSSSSDSSGSGSSTGSSSSTSSGSSSSGSAGSGGSGSSGSSSKAAAS